ncbi:MAG: hypothetical protein Q9190_004860 [Brigantiaea leucoxantha]
MNQAFENDFNLLWCNKLAADPSLKHVDTFSRVAHGEGGENSLLAISLNTSTTVRACRSFIRSSPDSKAIGTSAYVLFSLGSDINGIAGVCHGSIVTLMFDETFGQLMAHSFDRDELITAELTTSFRRPLKTPAVVLCKAQVEREPEGRKTWMNGEICDGNGIVFATGKGLYLRRKAKGHL